MNKNELTCVKHLGHCGALISWSKSGYRHQNPNNAVVFNANIVIDGKKTWYGDIDITLSKQKLIDLAIESKKTVYVLPEMAGRFDNEENPQIDQYIAKIEPDGTCELCSYMATRYTL